MKSYSYPIDEKQYCYCNFKIKWSLLLHSSKFLTIKGKDYGALEAKLSWNEPQLPHLKKSLMNRINWHTSRIRFLICPNKEKYYFWELSDIFKCKLCIKTFTANQYLAQTLFIQRTESTPCRLPLVLQGIPKSSHCSTLLIQSTGLERQRIQAVDSLECPVTKVLVCRGTFKKWGAQHILNLTLVK